MLKSGTIASRGVNLETKVIYETERHEIIAEKIFRAFDVGDLIKLYAIEKIEFGYGERIWKMPVDIQCPIIGKNEYRFIICYPKGHLVVRWIDLLNDGHKEFKWRTGIDNNGKNYYEIWRSK